MPCQHGAWLIAHGNKTVRGGVMGLGTIGSLNQYLKSVKLERKWEARQAGRTGKGSRAPLATGIQLNRGGSGMFIKAISSGKSQMDNSDIQKKLQKIKNKLKAGEKLTGEELSFLRKYAPELYRKVVALAKERENYEQRLKDADTRDEAEQIKTEKLAQSAAASKQKDPEFQLVRIAQFQAADSDTRKIVMLKPWRRELNQEKKKRLERAAEEQKERERRMKKLRRWNQERVRKRILEEKQADKEFVENQQMEKKQLLEELTESFPKEGLKGFTAATGEALVDGEAVTRGEISVDDAAMARRRVSAKKERERLSEIDLAMVQSAEARRVMIQEESVETESGKKGNLPSGFSMGVEAYAAAASRTEPEGVERQKGKYA